MKTDEGYKSGGKGRDTQTRLKFFEELAEIYCKKSRESVYRNDRVVMKTDEGYKSGGKG
jgi:hypothetical protein